MSAEARVRRGPGRPGVLCVAAFGAVLAGIVGCGGAEPPEGEENPLRDSPHVVNLFQPCRRSGFYDRDLSDLVPVLIEKLRFGEGEPLKRAKEELGRLGDESAEEIRRLFERSFTDMAQAPMIENALDAAAHNQSDIAHAVLISALTHPMDSVRHRAMLGLASSHARPEDFELFLERVGGVETVGIRLLYVRALHAADPTRAENEFLGWLESGTHKDLWIDIVKRLSRSERPATAARAGRIYRELDQPHKVWLAGAAARGADPAALAFLQEELQAEDPGRRIYAVEALKAAGRAEELAEALRTDPDEQVRVLALHGLAGQGAPSPDSLRWMIAALDDSSPTVQGEALKVLCAAGEPTAIDRALSYLSAESKLLSQSLAALRDPMFADPELARRALDRLLERYAGEEHRPVQQRTATFKAMGIVPLPAAARFLRTVAIASEGEVIESLKAHDWMMIQASNTGADGRALLESDLAWEDDPLRRLDLIVAVGSARDDAARAALLRLVEGDARTELEVLLAASRLVKIGPALRVAPRLKRISYGIEDVQIRTALQCLLWAWY